MLPFLLSNRLGDASIVYSTGRKRVTMQPNGGWIYASVWQNFAPDVFRSSLSPGVKSSPISRHHPRKHRCAFFCWELRGKYPVGQRVNELSLHCRNLHRQVPMASLSRIPQAAATAAGLQQRMTGTSGRKENWMMFSNLHISLVRQCLTSWPSSRG